MAKIDTYEQITPTEKDFLLGTDNETGFTKNFPINKIAEYVTGFFQSNQDNDYRTPKKYDCEFECLDENGNVKIDTIFDKGYWYFNLPFVYAENLGTNTITDNINSLVVIIDEFINAETQEEYVKQMIIDYSNWNVLVRTSLKSDIGNVEFKNINEQVILPVATESQAGILPIASQTDVDTGTDNTKAVTSLKLQNKLDNFPYATETDAGKIRLSTSQEVIDGVEQTSAVTPATLQDKLNGITTPEFATVDETITGTVDNKIVSPYDFANAVATEDNNGTIKLATQTQVDEGTDIQTAVTPATLQSKLNDLTSLFKIYGGERLIDNFSISSTDEVVNSGSITVDAQENASQFIVIPQIIVNDTSGQFSIINQNIVVRNKDLTTCTIEWSITTQGVDADYSFDLIIDYITLIKP